mgnify:CR=1 FL=1
MFKPSQKRRLLTASLLAVAMVLAGCQSKEEKAIKFAESGQAYMDEGDFERATLQFNNALFQDGTNLQALRGAAFIAERQQNYVRHARMLVRILDQVPNDIDANNAFARVSLLGGQGEKAKEHAERVLEQEPENVTALTTVGAALVLENDLDEATDILQRALAKDPDNPEIFNLLAAGSIRSQDFEEAIATIEEGIEAADNPETLLIVKLVLAERFRGREVVIETFNELIRLSPENGIYRRRLAEYYLLKDGDLETARNVYAEALPFLEEKTEVLTRIVAIDRRLKGEQQAEDTLQQYITANPDDSELRFALPALYCDREEFDRCRNEFSRLSELEGLSEEDRVRALNGVADVSMAERDFDAARVAADKVLEFDARDPDALITKGQLSLTEENAEEAIQFFREALNVDPDNTEGMVYLALAYEQSGQVKFADAQFARAIDQAGYTKEIINQYRPFLVRNNEQERAVELLQRYRRSNPNDPDAVFQDAEASIFENRYDDAEEAARRLLLIPEYEDRAEAMLVRALRGQQKYEEALPIADSFLARSPNNRQMLALRIDLLERLGRDAEARASLTDRLQSDTVIDDDYAMLGDMARRNDNAPEALNYARRGLEVFPDAESLYILSYLAETDMGNRDAAIAALLEGRSKATETARIRGYLSNEYIRAGDFESAMEALQSLEEDGLLTNLTANNLASLLLERQEYDKALEIATNFEGTQNPYFADTLGWAYFKAGNVEQAMRYIRIALNGLEDNPDVLYHAASIDAAQGRIAIARERFLKAKELHNPSSQTPVATIDDAIADLPSEE